jgi:hypothetical protein
MSLGSQADTLSRILDLIEGARVMTLGQASVWAGSPCGKSDEMGLGTLRSPLAGICLFAVSDTDRLRKGALAQI